MIGEAVQSQQKAQKWLKHVAASSTSNDLFTSSDEEDDVIPNKKDKGDEKKEAKEEKKEEFVLTKSEQELIEDEQVRCCYDCWLDYYRGICTECDYEYCIECRQQWHNNYDCNEIKRLKKEMHLKKELYDAQTAELMLKEGWRKCAGCKIWVEKSEGCNHMTHENCINPNEKHTGKTHFCYCCGELLYDPYHKYEKNGKLHFENGVFEPCRNNENAQIERNKLSVELQKHIDDVKSDMDMNDIKYDEKNEQCVVM